MIRPARPADGERITELVHRAYVPYVPQIGAQPAPMLTDYTDRIAEGDVWIDEDGAGATRAVLTLIASADHLLVENIAVDPIAQGNGIGTALVAFAESEARRRNIGELLLYTNARMLENLRFYKHLGFEITARKTEEGYDRIYMRKKLD